MSTESDDSLTRRQMLQILGAGLMVSMIDSDAEAQQRERGARNNPPRPAPNRPPSLAARLHIGKDGIITVMTGKVECGQGARAQITQAAAEELRVAPAHIMLVMGDTELCPDDGPTVGSRTTPNTVPAVRRAAAAARDVLMTLAAARLAVPKAELAANQGVITHTGGRTVSYGELVGDELSKALVDTIPGDGVQLTGVKEWKTLGTSVGRPNGREIVEGRHQYPSDIQRPGMLYGAVLRAPAVGSTLESIDLAPAQAMPGVVVVRDKGFVGVAAPKSSLARRAIEALARTATWRASPQVSTPGLFEHLRKTASKPEALVNTADDVALKAEYQVAYVQHAPLEPRAAVAEWQEGKLTVWTGTQIPSRVKGELQSAFSLAGDAVRVIVPDFGGGFGGKHTGECAVEAARLARAAGKPVSLRWTRHEEFQWASFRPAALILAEAGLNDAGVPDAGVLGSWFFTNINSGAAALQTPYRVTARRQQYVESASPPLRHGSYRGLAATANNFARESFMDELAARARRDPLAFRLAHLDDDRLIAVLKAAAEKFDFLTRFAAKDPATGVGLACGIEKGSYVACCVQIGIDPNTRQIKVRHVTTAYECGKIQNPEGLLAQVNGAIVQGLGPALSEEILLDNGRVTNASFDDYRVPRFADLPTLETLLLDRPDLPSVGAGETPIMAIAPAIGNAVFHATGQRLRAMPIRLA